MGYRGKPREYARDYGYGRRNELGVLTVEPYKSEILPHWRFRTPEVARRSAEQIWRTFQEYGRRGDAVGMDMARKFMQMGYTRAMRYAKHRSGVKYDDRGHVRPYERDEQKRRSAQEFKHYLDRMWRDPTYQRYVRELKK